MAGLGNIDDVYNHYLKVIEENKQLKAKLDISVKALNTMVAYNSVAEQVDKYYHIVIDVRSIGKEALEKIKEIK